MTDRALDKTGFPIVPGARVHVGERPTRLSLIPVSGFSGTVLEVSSHPKHGWVIDVRDESCSATRTVQAKYARVQAHIETESDRIDREHRTAQAANRKMRRRR